MRRKRRRKRRGEGSINDETNMGDEIGEKKRDVRERRESLNAKPRAAHKFSGDVKGRKKSRKR